MTHLKSKLLWLYGSIKPHYLLMLALAVCPLTVFATAPKAPSPTVNTTTSISSSALFPGQSRVSIAELLQTIAAQANEVVTRNGLEPADQSKVTRVLARERLRANASPSGNDAPAGAGARAAGKPQDCTTNIGTVNAQESRPGVRGPRENITVIKAPVVNKC